MTGRQGAIKGGLFCAVLALGVLALSAPAAAQGKAGDGFGLGIILGDPSGLTLKQWLNSSNAFDVHLAFDFTDEDVTVIADYLFHFDAFKLRTNAVDVPLYVGIGGKLGIDANDNDRRRDDDDDTNIGLAVRIPLGVSVLFRSVPLEIFAEVVPGVLVIPRTNGILDGGIGIRYYF